MIEKQNESRNRISFESIKYFIKIHDSVGNAIGIKRNKQ